VGNPDILYSELNLSAAEDFLHYSFRWEKNRLTGDNFSFNVKASGAEQWEMDINIDGSLVAGHDNGYIDMQVKEAKIQLDMPAGNIGATLHGRYMLRGDTNALVMDGEQRTLSSINEIDLLAMMGKLANHPQLGDLLGGFLPF
jgi:hypothetical protein